MEDVFGYSMGDLTWASERLAAERLSDCMISRGWDFDRTLPERFDPSAHERLTTADLALIELEQQGWDHGGDAEEPPEYSRDEADCWESVVGSVPDPASAAWSWIHGQAEDLYHRVAADLRVVDAKAEEMKCIAAAGYDPNSVRDVSNSFTDAVQNVVGSVWSGDKDVDDVVDELLALAEEEGRMWSAVDPCVNARLEVAGTVARELEAEWLAENADRLAVAVAELESDVSELGEHLEAIAEGE